MDFIRDYWSQFLTGLSTLGLTIGSLGFSWRTQPPPLPPWHERWEVWVLWLSAATFVISVIATAKKSQRVSILNSEVVTLRSSLQHLERGLPMTKIYQQKPLPTI